MPIWFWFMIYLLPGTWCIWMSRTNDDTKYSMFARIWVRLFALLLWWLFLILVLIDMRKMKQ